MLGREVVTVVGVTVFGGILDTLVPALAVLVALAVVVGAVAAFLLHRASRAGGRPAQCVVRAWSTRVVGTPVGPAPDADPSTPPGA